MHPTGSLLATASADGTVKIWDFVDASCRVTLSDHSQVVWGCAFHSQGTRDNASPPARPSHKG